MKKAFILVICLLFVALGNNAQSQMWSSITSFSPSNSTLISGASRFGHHNINWSTYYMRYNDSSYFCSILYPNTVPTMMMSNKILMPQDFVVTDMKKFYYYQGFIGSYQGVGMFGRAVSYYYTAGNSIFIFKLPAVDVLTRIATHAVIFEEDKLVKAKAFATGEKAIGQNAIQSYLLEFIADGVGETGPYLYAPLYYNSVTREKETADDVIIIDNKVIFATRDTRTTHAPVNLRISDTTSALTHSEIGTQWQLWLPASQKVISELRLLYLDHDDYFVLAYIVFDQNSNAYYLCTNRIKLSDLLSLNNTIVSHKIKIGSECINLVDAIYETNANTMVILLNGNNMSELYHIDPYSSSSSTTIVLDYPDGNLYSIDTVGDHENIDMYVAMGDSTFFSQDISNGIAIDYSCLDIKKKEMPLQQPPIVNKIKDLITGYSAEKDITHLIRPSVYFFGTRICDDYIPIERVKYE